MTDRQRYRELYWCWKAIKQRCLNPRCHAYHNYGGRGIAVCKEWLQFEPFLAWALANGWEKGLDLDRRDNNGGYTPENCRFVTRRENANNRRATILLSVDGVTRPVTQWADITGIGRGTIGSWVRNHGKDYASRRLAEAISDGYAKGDYSRNHKTIPVMHIESGMRFASIRRAARHFNINNGQLYNAIKYGHNTRVGHFARVEEVA